MKFSLLILIDSWFGLVWHNRSNISLLSPFLRVSVHKPHVEERGEDEGEAGDEHGADQLEDGAEAG